MLATIAGILILNFLGFIVFFTIIGIASSGDAPSVEENSVLVAEFNHPVSDRSDNNPFSQFASGTFSLEGTMGLDQILENLDKAKKDENISGIFMRLSAVPISMATVEEIRNAMIDFKESGKFIISHADFYTQKSYYLATVSDKIYLTPTGEMDFRGLAAQVMFFKRALDNAGVELQVVRHGSYKSAVEPFMADEISDENREQLDAMISSLWEKMLSEISTARGIDKALLEQYADDLSAMLDHEALDKGMIDGIIYYDELLAELKSRTDTDMDDDVPAITMRKYMEVEPAEKKEASRNRIAVIYAAGTIVPGKADEGMIGADRISRAIRKAREDDKVKAIVFRVNSGGGSALASEIIHREVKLASEVKPVVASLGATAASGGYYIVCPADTILASESTLTGSIGVFGLFPNFQELMEDKIGISTEVVKTSRSADMGSPMRPLTAEERKVLQSYVDDTYTTFVNHVVDGRSMTYEEVDAVGGGRIWSGTDALEIGLIDEIGGLERSIEVAAEMAGLDNYRIRELPALEDPFTVFMNQLSGGVKSRIIQKELGPAYDLYRKTEEIKQYKGLQAIMPFSIEIH